MSQPTSLAIEDRCENWAAWYRKEGRWIKTARSLEGQWRSPQCWEPLPPGTVRLTDAADAQIVESAVRIIAMYPQALLRLYYVRNLPPRACLSIAAKLADEGRGRNSGWDAMLDMAHALLIEALDLPAVIRKDRARRIVLKVVDSGRD